MQKVNIFIAVCATYFTQVGKTNKLEPQFKIEKLYFVNSFSKLSANSNNSSIKKNLCLILLQF